MATVVVCSDQDGPLDDPYLDLLKDAGFEVRPVLDEKFARGHRTDAEQVELLRGASAVVAWGQRFPRPVLESLPDLRVIARMGVGYDKIDVDAATDLGVVVAITPTANHEAVAEHALALMLALAKSVVSGDKRMRTGGWPSDTRRPIRGQTLGIVGLGRIGRSLAIRAKAMGMVLIATEVAPDQRFVDEVGISIIDLNTLLETADYVSLHCPLSDETRGMIDREKLARMKPDAALINTARGGLVVEADLVEALRSGAIGSAGLDVFEQEPTSPDNPLYDLDNVVVSPHLAGNDSLGVENMGIEAAQSIIDLSKGGWPEGAVVNSELEGSWRW